MVVDKDRVSTADSYRTYIATTDHPVSKPIYVDIINEFFLFLMSLILDGQHIKLPFASGSILVRGRKITPKIENGEIKGASPDWPATKALWARNPEAKAAGKKIYCLNEHSNGIRYRLFWIKKGVRIENQSLYSLQFSRDNKRALVKRIREGKEYFVKI